MIPYVVILLLVFVILYQHFRYNHHLKRLTQVVTEINRGNPSQRFRLQSENPKLNGLTTVLNKWTDEVQDKMIRLTYLEEEYKKILSHLSHDLRTPLTSLLGYTEVLKDSKEISSEESASYLTIIHEKAMKIHSIISHFFELARLESSEDEFQPERFNVSDVIREAMLSFYQSIEKEGITPEINLPEEPVTIKGSKDATERILMNLLSNAIRYGAGGGVLGIGLRQEVDIVWVDVWDRGQGISAKDLPHIFKRLYTGTPSRSTHIQGTGLGLTIAKKLVEKQGGEMKVESIPRKKTTFSFSIPTS